MQVDLAVLEAGGGDPSIDSHNLMRIRSMSEKALRTRIWKITRVDKLHSFVLVRVCCVMWVAKGVHVKCQEGSCQVSRIHAAFCCLRHQAQAGRQCSMPEVAGVCLTRNPMQGLQVGGVAELAALLNLSCSVPHYPRFAGAGCVRHGRAGGRGARSAQPAHGRRCDELRGREVTRAGPVDTAPAAALPGLCLQLLGVTMAGWKGPNQQPVCCKCENACKQRKLGRQRSCTC